MCSSVSASSLDWCFNVSGVVLVTDEVRPPTSVESTPGSVYHTAAQKT